MPWHNTRLHALVPPRFLGMDDLTIEHSIDLQATWIIGVLGICFDLLFLSVCTTKLWQTSGRMVQELNVCTAGVIQLKLTMEIAERCILEYDNDKPWEADEYNGLSEENES